VYVQREVISSMIKRIQREDAQSYFPLNTFNHTGNYFPLNIHIDLSPPLSSNIHTDRTFIGRNMTQLRCTRMHRHNPDK
jgi:hypothetical protein